MTKAVESGMPKLRIEEAAARRQARVDRGDEVIVGVNKYRLADRAAGRRSATSTTPRCGEQQIARLEQLRADRDQAAGRRGARRAHATGARATATCSSCAIDATRARATVGEISDALEEVFGRHRATIRTHLGRVRRRVRRRRGLREQSASDVEAFAAEEGRRPRILVAKLGQDGHDRGAKVIATAFADLGFDVDVGPLFQTPEEAARDAIENDVHVVGVSQPGRRAQDPRARS